MISAAFMGNNNQPKPTFLCGFFFGTVQPLRSDGQMRNRNRGGKPTVSGSDLFTLESHFLGHNMRYAHS